MPAVDVPVGDMTSVACENAFAAQDWMETTVAQRIERITRQKAANEIACAVAAQDDMGRGTDAEWKATLARILKDCTNESAADEKAFAAAAQDDTGKELDNTREDADNMVEAIMRSKVDAPVSSFCHIPLPKVLRISYEAACREVDTKQRRNRRRY
jgi:hypothetical protein